MASKNDGWERIYISRAAIISGWIRDQRFNDNRGLPASLTFAQGNPTFIELVEAFGNGKTAEKLLDDLIEVGTIMITEDGRIILMHRK